MGSLHLSGIGFWEWERESFYRLLINNNGGTGTSGLLNLKNQIEWFFFISSMLTHPISWHNFENISFRIWVWRQDMPLHCKLKAYRSTKQLIFQNGNWLCLTERSTFLIYPLVSLRSNYVSCTSKYLSTLKDPVTINTT